MKNYLLVLVFLFFGMMDVMGQSGQAVFDEANTHFENGELSEAMNLYRNLEQNNQVSGALYLNMGIIAVQLDSMGLAKYYFLKSAEFEETEERALRAVEYVTSQFSRQSATLPKLPWDRAVEWLINVPTAFGVFLIGVGIICLGLIFLYLKWFNYLQQMNYSWIIPASLTTGILILLLSFYVDYVDQRYDEAVLITDSQRVLQSPEDESALVSIAYEGYSITVDQWKSSDYENWLYIRLGNGQYGWINQEGIKIL